jgi:hypothetical protein
MARYPRAAQLLDFVYLEPHSIVLNDNIITPFAGNYFISEIMTRIDETEVTKEYTLVNREVDYFTCGGY